jgi:hypothetical protein
MAPDPTLDPTTFSLILRMQKIFPYFSLITLAHRKIKFFAKILCQNFILQALFQSAQNIYAKREGSGSVPLTNGSGSRRLKIMKFRIRIPNSAEEERSLHCRATD